MPPIGQLWTYRYFDPFSRQFQVLDCYAETVEAGLASAQRFMSRLAKTMAVNVPSHPDQMTLVEADNDNTPLPLVRLSAPFD